MKINDRRSKYLPHNGEREKERRRIGGFYTRHDHTLHRERITPTAVFYDRRCPVCDRAELK